MNSQIKNDEKNDDEQIEDDVLTNNLGVSLNFFAESFTNSFEIKHRSRYCGCDNKNRLHVYVRKRV